jgi:hypothetical protein
MGQSLSAIWRVSNIAPEVVVDGLEASVMWYTEGKGDEDLNVHHFRRWSDVQFKELDLNQSHGFQCALPLTPLSYEGTLLRIRWCVRLRLFCSVGRDSVAQVPFQLISDAMPNVPTGRVTDVVTEIDASLGGHDLTAESGNAAYGRL